MKNLSSKEVNESWNQALRQMRYTHHGIKPQPHLSKLPTPQQLATLAATLARQSNNNSDKLCSEAMNLWATAYEYIALQRLCDKDWQIEKARMDANRIEPAEPKRYPITRDDFCRLVLPKLNGRTGERASIIRTWLSHALAMDRWMVTDQKNQFRSSHRLKLKLMRLLRRCKVSRWIIQPIGFVLTIFLSGIKNGEQRKRAASGQRRHKPDIEKLESPLDINRTAKSRHLHPRFTVLHSCVCFLLYSHGGKQKVIGHLL